MAWKRVKDNSDAVGTPKLTGEAGYNYWVDDSGERVYPQAVSDFPTPSGKGGSVFPGTDKDGVNVKPTGTTIQDVFDEVKKVKEILLAFVNKG